MGTLRIHFTGEDLARVRVAPAPDPLWEVVLSAYSLRDPGPCADVAAWRGQARTALTRRPLSDGERMLAELTRPGAFPDFLTPLEALSGVGEGLDAVRATPCAQLREEIEHIGSQRALPSWSHDLARGRGITTLADGLQAYFDAVIRPHWPTIHAHVDAERGRRARAFLDGGCEQVLAGLRPLLRWQSPVLETTYLVDREIHLDGRGLLLIPSYFCWGAPVTLVDDARCTPLLVYPVEHDLALAPAGLAPLIGHTRAELLRLLVDAHLTTGELARRLNVTAGNVSQHTKVLRAAGLITTSRHANLVVHTVAPLGRRLLDG